MNKNILFSILIPAYKKQYFKDCIDSVLSQTYESFELIIVDDASPEDIADVVYQYEDSRIKYYRNDTNFGAVNVVDNWNKCLSYATGDYVICMGDDDILPPTSLEQYHDLICEYPQIKVFHGRTELIDEENKSIALLEPRDVDESTLSLIYYRWKGRYQFIGDFCFETKALRSMGGFYKLPMAWGSDDISVVRQAEAGGGIVNSNEILFKYRDNRLSISSSGSLLNKLEAVRLEEKWYETFLENYKRKDGSEKLFYQYINDIKGAYFFKKRLNIIITIISQAPLRFFFFLFNKGKYGLNIKLLIYVLLMGMVEKGKTHYKSNYLS